jgi:uncharacterized protein (DUF3820 family)
MNIGCQNQIIPFGKYKGKDLLFVAENNPNYLTWLQTVANGKLKENLDKFLATDYFMDCYREHQEGEERYLDANHDYSWSR